MEHLRNYRKAIRSRKKRWKENLPQFQPEKSDLDNNDLDNNDLDDNYLMSDNDHLDDDRLMWDDDRLMSDNNHLDDNSVNLKNIQCCKKIIKLCKKMNHILEDNCNMSPLSQIFNEREKTILRGLSAKINCLIDPSFVMPIKFKIFKRKKPDRRTINKAKNNLLDILFWQCDEDPAKIHVIQNAILQDWQDIGARETQSLQHCAMLSDRHFQMFKNHFTELSSVKLASMNKIKELRKRYQRIMSGHTFDMILDVKNPKQNGNRLQATFPIYACDDREAACKLIDSHINNNI